MPSSRMRITLIVAAASLALVASMALFSRSSGPYVAPGPSAVRPSLDSRATTSAAANIVQSGGAAPMRAPAAQTQDTQPAPSTVPASSTPLDYNVGFSLATTPLSLSSSALAAEFDDIASLRVGWIRIDFDWSVIQPESASRFDWADYDRVVAAADARGIKVLGIIDYTPAWARAQGCTYFKCPPASPDRFAAFASAVVQRYAAKGVHDWEIWNEPNMAGSWYPRADAAAYVSLLQKTYAAIKKEDPSATVITGGLGPIGTGSGNVAPLLFLQEMYSDGAKGSFDAVGDHPYSFPLFPSDVRPGNAWSQMSQTNPSFRSIMTSYGDSSKRIWMTEYGAPTGGPRAISEDAQAREISQAVSRTASYSWAGPLFIYSYRDIGTAQDTSENFYGILRYDGSAKPAYDALKSSIAGQQK